MIVRSLVLLALLAPVHVFAAKAKNFTVGFGTYALVVVYDDDRLANDEFAGLSVSASYAFSDRIGIRASYYSVDNSDVAALDNSGYDLLAYLGDGLHSRGFKIYVGGGFFNEDWDIGGNSEQFSGLQIGGGLGYNWDNLALDLVAALREASDYEEAFLRNNGIGVNAAAASAGLVFSARF